MRKITAAAHKGGLSLCTPPASDQHNVSRRHQVLQLSCFSCSLPPLRLRRPASCCLVRSSSRYKPSLRKFLLLPNSAGLASPGSSCKCRSCFSTLRVLMGCRAAKDIWDKRPPADIVRMMTRPRPQLCTFIRIRLHQTHRRFVCQTFRCTARSQILLRLA